MSTEVDKLSGVLSGGNKRKLSVAMAMIGDPKIVFLDEPSTGMDPLTRRCMWRIIEKIAAKEDTTIILTTHVMEEVEALATRIGIMIDGKFRCMGTTRFIRDKYGEGYEISIKYREPSEAKINIFQKLVNDSGIKF